MSRLNSTNEEFNKIKDGLINDIKIIQTEQANSQKKLKLAEEIAQKTKTEYKKLNDEYIKLEHYKNKCEKFIQHLQGENSNLTQKLSNLHKKQQNNNTTTTTNTQAVKKIIQIIIIKYKIKTVKNLSQNQKKKKKKSTKN